MQQPLSKPRNYRFAIKHKTKPQKAATLVFNAWAERFDSHPIIFFKGDNDVYYYLSARSAYEEDLETNTLVLRQPFPGEVLIAPKTNKTHPNELFKDYSYVDTSQIFMIDAQDLFLKIDPQDLTWFHNALDRDEVTTITNLMLTNLIFNHSTLSDITYDESKDIYQSEVVFSNLETLERSEAYLGTNWDATKIANHKQKVVYDSIETLEEWQIIKNVVARILEHHKLTTWDRQTQFQNLQTSFLRSYPKLSPSKPIPDNHYKNFKR